MELTDVLQAQSGMIILQVATLVVQAFLTGFTAYLAFRAEEAKRDRDAKARSLHNHLERQTGQLTESLQDGKVFRP